jgi:hypothetical protein
MYRSLARSSIMQMVVESASKVGPYRRASPSFEKAVAFRLYVSALNFVVYIMKMIP